MAKPPTEGQVADELDELEVDISDTLEDAEAATGPDHDESSEPQGHDAPIGPGPGGLDFPDIDALIAKAEADLDDDA